MLNVTAEAVAKIKSVIEAEKRAEVPAVRVSADEIGASYRYRLEFVEKGDRKDDDACLDADGVQVLIDAESGPRLEGATLEYVDDVSGSGFRFDNPNRPKLLENPLAARVQKFLDEQVNPSVASHGGFVTLFDVQDTRVFLQMGGGCQGCGQADVTLRQGIETMLRQEIPEITEILDSTDHAAGANPYYR